MNRLILMTLLMLSYFISFGQKVISFNTSYYGYKEPYCELYLCSDSVFLNEFKNEKTSQVVKYFELVGRQKFVWIDIETFNKILAFVKRRDEKIAEIDFPQPFKEVYYVKIYNYQSKTVKITSTFGNDIKKALVYFTDLKTYLAQCKNNLTLLNELDKITETLETSSL